MAEIIQLPTAAELPVKQPRRSKNNIRDNCIELRRRKVDMSFNGELKTKQRVERYAFLLAAVQREAAMFADGLEQAKYELAALTSRKKK